MSLTDQLDAYLRLLDQRHDGWFSPRLRPGLSGQELDDMEERFGRAFPAEVRELYSWRDGPAGTDTHFFPTFEVWYPLEHALLSSSSLSFMRQNMQDAGLDVGELVLGLPISGSDGYFYVVETDGPLVGAAYRSTDVECFQVTDSLSSYLKTFHRLVEETDTIVLDDRGLFPKANDWIGGITERRPGIEGSAWPPLKNN